VRILHCIGSVDPKTGGPIEGIRQRQAVLAGWGHEVEACSLDDPRAPYLEGFPFPVHALGPGVGPFAYTRRLLPWLLEHAGGFGAVVVNGIWQYHSLAVRSAMRRIGKPYWVFTHGMLDPWFNEAYPLKRLKKNLYWRWGEYRVLRDAEAVAFTTEEEKILARRSFRPYRVREAVVSYGTGGPDVGRDEALPAFYAACPAVEGRRFLLFLSRIHEKKGCDLLLRSFARAQDASLDLVVAGPDQQGLAAGLASEAQALGVGGRVHFPGMLRGAAKWGAFMAADAFVLPSHQENFGIVVAEALAAGTPVLLSNKVNVWREVVEDGAGLVEPDDQEGTDRLLARWLAMDESAASVMRARARPCYESRFTVEASARSLLELVGHQEQASV
jgi:glycosyltransferase involved in cell wall biosynthesis